MTLIKFGLFLDVKASYYEHVKEKEREEVESYDSDDPSLVDVLASVIHQSRMDRAAGKAEVLRSLLMELPEEILEMDVDLEDLEV